jgi:hypothetical protein
MLSKQGIALVRDTPNRVLTLSVPGFEVMKVPQRPGRSQRDIFDGAVEIGQVVFDV